MKFVLHVIAIALLGGIMELFLPWWSLAIAAFICGWIFESNGWQSFFAGLIGAGLLWFGYAYYLDASTNSILTMKVAAIFPTKTIGLLILVTSVIGGLVGGFASLSGSIISYRPKRR